LCVQQHGVLFATLHIPATRNALAPEVVQELATVVDLAAADPGVRALVLRGSQGFFCAGGNLGNFESRLRAGQPVDGVEGETDPVAARNREFGRFMERLVGLPVPVIAVVEGAAMGGGMGLACAADLVLATTDARFALSETSLGLLPAQIAPFVVQRLGPRNAARLALWGERVSGGLARELGLVDELAEDGAALDALLARWLTQLCRGAPQATRRLKPLLRRCVQEPLPALLDDAARQFSACMRDEGVEGLAAFREKRDARWRRVFDAAQVRAAQDPAQHGGGPATATAA
jgi:isohexenylglutaconyl-CoA hydratase